MMLVDTTGLQVMVEAINNVLLSPNTMVPD